MTGRRMALAVALCMFGGSAVASATGLPTLKLKRGVTLAQSIAGLERRANRAAGFSNADCWVYQGNARTGWRHGACVGTYNYGGTDYRFKLTVTPVSCSKLRETIVIPGVEKETSIEHWTHETFACGP